MITSTSNDRVRKVVSYNEKSKARREDDVFVIEGMKMLREAPVLQVREVYVTERFVKNASEDDNPEMDVKEIAGDWNELWE